MTAAASRPYRTLAVYGRNGGRRPFMSFHGNITLIQIGMNFIYKSAYRIRLIGSVRGAVLRHRRNAQADQCARDH